MLNLAEHLYIHIPFCKRKCPYCDFYSIPVVQTDEIIEKYLQALNHEIDLRKKYADKLKTIYLGGGTPSILSSEILAKLMKMVTDNFSIENNAEITIEANPESLSTEFANSSIENGINRLSIGMQSLSDEKLQFLGRIHSANQNFKAFENARNAGFENISVDIISAVPEESKQKALDDISRAIELKPEHISVYNLIIEENTPFEKFLDEQKFKTLDEDSVSEIYIATQKLLNLADYKQYEISNFARTGLESAHNLGYWRYENYLGIGAGAHSKLGNVRSANKKNVNAYFELDFVDFTEKLSNWQQIEEILMLGLRIREGVDLNKLSGLMDKKDFIERVMKISEIPQFVQVKSNALFVKPEFMVLADELILQIITSISGS